MLLVVSRIHVTLQSNNPALQIAGPDLASPCHNGLDATLSYASIITVIKQLCSWLHAWLWQTCMTMYVFVDLCRVLLPSLPWCAGANLQGKQAAKNAGRTGKGRRRRTTMTKRLDHRRSIQTNTTGTLMETEIWTSAVVCKMDEKGPHLMATASICEHADMKPCLSTTALCTVLALVVDDSDELMQRYSDWLCINSVTSETKANCVYQFRALLEAWTHAQDAGLILDLTK